MGAPPHGVRQPPRLVPGSTGWGGRRKPPPPPVRPWPSPCRAGLKAWCPARFPGDGAVRLPGSVLKAPVSCGAPGNPMCWVRQASPTCPPPSLRGQLTRAPPLRACRTLTPHLPSHVLDTGQVPRQSRGSGDAAQGAWCWPSGHVTRSSLEREGRPPSLFTGRDCAVPFCLCNINTDFYTSPLCLPVLSTPVLGFPPQSPGRPRRCSPPYRGLGFLGDPADHGPPLPRSRPLGPVDVPWRRRWG